MVNNNDRDLTRRRVLQGAGSLIAAAALPTRLAATPPPGQGGPAPRSADVTGRLARYMVEARDRGLPADVAREAKHRILDTLGAIVSGARMRAAWQQTQARRRSTKPALRRSEMGGSWRSTVVRAACGTYCPNC